ncbi:ATP-binding protein [Aliarcobacter butzleri]|uniref:ATP-binding protein n=1 Tax=Aliarcobacter butzleri TaxID=28197 RepID=UPI00125F477E|nr:ATP-binding protein [Aliarcobacter butzleri]
MDDNYKSIETEFKPKARLLLQLGDQLIRNEKIAVSELIKNSYDAGARNVIVTMNDIANDEYFKNAVICIEDDGIGMNIDIIRDVWMEPGTNYKEEKNKADFLGLLGRRPIGEKGIGRFGVHKLGNRIKIVSKQENSPEVVFEINWRDFQSNDYLSNKLIKIYERPSRLFTNGKTGTFIEIKDLHNPWTVKEFRDLYRSSFTLSSPFETVDSFKIQINTNLFDWTEKLLTLEDIKRHALWHFECEVEEVVNDKNVLETKITHFLYKFQPTSLMEVPAKNITIDDTFIKTNPYIRLEKDKLILKQEEEKYRIELEDYKKNKTIPKPEKPEKFFDPSLKNIGKIRIKGYIFDLDPDTLELSDIEDIAGFKEYTKINGGVRVYRDNMRIFDYGEEGNDWLKMDAKRINAPTVKIANRNIIASVFLNGLTSQGLIEKTNREGFIENDDFEHFKGVVSNIINKVNKLRNLDKEALKRTYFEEQDSTINANVLIEKTKNKISKYINIHEHKEEVLRLIEKVEENYNSVKDIVLKSSGAGLAYSLVMHEIEKMISGLEHSVKNKDYEEVFEISKALSSVIDNITSLLSNDKVKCISILNILDKAFYFFNRRFNKHEIEIIKNFENKEYMINCLSSLSVHTIMNIMDNSIYWLGYWKNDIKNNGKIYFDIVDKEDFISLIIADNGKGFYISEDIAKLPFKTTKDQNLGKGLGLYFVNEIMKQNDGYFKIITNKMYKKEELDLPDEFLDGATIILQFRKA